MGNGNNTNSEAYLNYHRNCGIKNGDTVKVLFKTSGGNPGGWKNSWTYSMDRMVNQTCVVTSDNGAKGFGLFGCENYSFPAFCLELVEPVKTIKKMTVAEIAKALGHEVEIIK